MVTYKKKNNDLVQRIVKCCDYVVGDTNSYGWLVVDIQAYYNGRFYSIDEYDSIINYNIEKYELKRKRKKAFKKILSKPIKVVNKKLNDLLCVIDKL